MHPLRTYQREDRRIKHRFTNGLFYPHASTFSAMRRFSSVHELSLFHVSLHTLADLRRTISSFTALRTLILLSPHWLHADSHPLPASYFPCRSRIWSLYLGVTHSWLHDNRSLFLVNWLGRSGITSCLRTLEMVQCTILDEPWLAAVEMLLNNCRDTITYTSIGFGPQVKFGSGAYHL